MALDGFWNPLIFRTNCSAAALNSSVVAGCSGLRNRLMLRHIIHILPKPNLPSRDRKGAIPPAARSSYKQAYLTDIYRRQEPSVGNQQNHVAVVVLEAANFRFHFAAGNPARAVNTRNLGSDRTPANCGTTFNSNSAPDRSSYAFSSHGSIRSTSPMDAYTDATLKARPLQF